MKSKPLKNPFARNLFWKYPGNTATFFLLTWFTALDGWYCRYVLSWIYGWCGASVHTHMWQFWNKILVCNHIFKEIFRNRLYRLTSNLTTILEPHELEENPFRTINQQNPFPPPSFDYLQSIIFCSNIDHHSAKLLPILWYVRDVSFV